MLIISIPSTVGKFTCEATDFGVSLNKSVTIHVIIQPLVYLDPLSQSVPAGSNITVRCLSPDDTQNTFKVIILLLLSSLSVLCDMSILSGFLLSKEQLPQNMKKHKRHKYKPCE